MYIYIYTFIHILNVYTHKCTYCIHACVYIYIFMYMHVHLNIYIYTYACTCTCRYIQVSVYTRIDRSDVGFDQCHGLDILVGVTLLGYMDDLFRNTWTNQDILHSLDKFLCFFFRAIHIHSCMRYSAFNVCFHPREILYKAV